MNFVVYFDNLLNISIASLPNTFNFDTSNVLTIVEICVLGWTLRELVRNNKKNSFYSVHSKITELHNMVVNLDIEWENSRIESYCLKNYEAIKINEAKRERLKFYMLNTYELLLKLLISLEDKELKQFQNYADDIKCTLEDESMWELVEKANSYPLFYEFKNQNYDLQQTKNKALDQNIKIWYI